MKIFSHTYIYVKQKFDFWLLGISAISLILRDLIPININVVSPHDDFLGVRLADNLLQGKWFGAWSNTTLLKPPTYSIFLFLTHWIPIATTVLVQLLLLGAFFWFAVVLSKFYSFSGNKKQIVTRCVFATLAFNPFLYSASFSRIYRNQIYVVLLCYLFVVTLYLSKEIKNSKIKTDVKDLGINYKRKLSIFSTFIGLLAALLIMTRKESTWLIAPCFVLIMYLMIKNLYYSHKNKTSKDTRELETYSKMIIVIFFALALPLICIAQINKQVYGSALIENFSSGQFARAMNLWQGVSSGQDSRLNVPITFEQRNTVYDISSTAKTMEPFLDSVPAASSPVNFWLSFNCSNAKICDNAGGAWQPFEIRDAAVLAGRITSELEFQEFFKKIGDDISIGCHKKIIECSHPGFAPGVPSLQRMPKKQIMTNATNVFNTWLNLSPMQDAYINNGNDATFLKTWHSVVRFDEVYIPNSDLQWKHLGPVLGVLTSIYGPISIFLFLSLIVSLFKTGRKNLNEVPKIFLLTFLIALILFCLGVGILSIAWGFSVLGIYTIPAQPIFLMLCIMGTTNLAYSRNTDE